MASLLLEELRLEEKAREFGVNVFERAWLGETMSLVHISDIMVKDGRLTRGEPMWINSYGVSGILSRLVEDLRPVERPGVKTEGEQLGRLERFLDEARLPGLVATYLTLNTDERVEDFVPKGAGEPQLIFGISGPPGRMKSTLMAELARRTGYPIAVVEPKHQNWNAAKYLGVIKESRVRDFAGARKVIGDYIGEEGRKRKGGELLQAPGDTRSMIDVLGGVSEMFRGGRLGGAKWILCDLGGWPRIKNLGFVGAWEKSRGLNVFDLVGQESLEKTTVLKDQLISDEEAEGLVDRLTKELLCDTETRGKWERFAETVREGGTG